MLQSGRYFLVIAFACTIKDNLTTYSMKKGLTEL
ncbi:Uncharacterised protein [Vibrio cholerae]|nr:Uncharacterised protein [Vibrio cholerae]